MSVGVLNITELLVCVAEIYQPFLGQIRLLFLSEDVHLMQFTKSNF